MQVKGGERFGSSVPPQKPPPTHSIFIEAVGLINELCKSSYPLGHLQTASLFTVQALISILFMASHH